MPNCPKCGAPLIIKDNKYYCKFCRYISDEQIVKPAEPEKIKEIIIEKQVVVEHKQVESNLNREFRNPAEEVYSNNVDGVAEIINEECNCCGSAFVVSDDGYLLTNAHVVCDDDGNCADEVIAVINGKETVCEIIYCGEPLTANDLAILKEKKRIKNQKALKLGNSDNLRNGQQVYSIGNSLGEGICITSGIISDAERYIEDEAFIMSDVALNPGNSGGPLFDQYGNVIAIAVMERENGDGMKYFIPVNNAIELLEEYEII